MVGCIFILFGEAAVLRFLSKTEIIGGLSKDYSNDDYFKYECHPEKYGASFLKYYIERYQGF